MDDVVVFIGIGIVEPENSVVYRLQSVENNRDLQPPQANALQFATKTVGSHKFQIRTIKKPAKRAFFDAHRA